ncbi:MAG TPA: hypothetical protein VIY48_18880 [Candidatus Paceibacterota bacterium]
MSTIILIQVATADPLTFRTHGIASTFRAARNVAQSAVDFELRWDHRTAWGRQVSQTFAWGSGQPRTNYFVLTEIPVITEPKAREMLRQTRSIL